jgi:Fe-S oxidoreductase
MAVVKIIIFLMLIAFALYSFVMGIKERYNILSMGKAENRFDKRGERLRGALAIVLGQKRVLRDPGAGIMHVFIFWGMIFFSLGMIQFILEGLFPGFILPVLGSSPFFYLIVDIFGLLAAVGMLISAYRRYIAKVQRLGVGDWAEERIIVALIAGIVLLVSSYFISAGASAYSAGHARYSLAPVTGLFMSLFSGFPVPVRQVWYEVFWWINVLLALGLMVFFRYSHLVHPLAAPINIYFRNLQPRGGSIKPLDFESDEVENYGVSKITDYTWKQLLDCYACAECGRCQENCPAYLSEKPLSPKKLIGDLKEHLPRQSKTAAATGTGGTAEVTELDATLDTGGGQPELPEVAGEVISEDAIWACTTCYACQEHCPNLNEHINKIIDLRRHLVLDRSEFPAEAQLAFTNLERNFNPWGVGWTNRVNWAGELGVQTLEDNKNAEYLLFVGCAGSFDDRAKSVTAALVKILQASGTNFAILGSEEKCCGDSARRLGNEYLFVTLAEENIGLLNEYGVKKIITACPHCFNTLKNEYPQFGGNFEVIHHTQFIARLIKDKKIVLSGESKPFKLTYHDSCYLGRHNHEYEAPRRIISALPGAQLVEMERRENRAFCCGAGGGRMWLEEKGKRINNMRTEQALAAGTEVIAVNCPFCLTMIEDGLKEYEQSEKVMTRDLAELVVRYL